MNRLSIGIALIAIPAFAQAQEYEGEGLKGFLGSNMVSASVEFQNIEEDEGHGSEDYNYSAPKLSGAMVLYENESGFGIDAEASIKHWQNTNHRSEYHYNGTVLDVGLLAYKEGIVTPFVGVSYGFDHWDMDYGEEGLHDEDGNDSEMAFSAGFEYQIAPGFFIKPEINYVVPFDDEEDDTFEYRVDALFWLTDMVGVNAGFGYESEDNEDVYMSEVGLSFRF